MIVTRLSAEHRDPLGIGTPLPRLSWVTLTDEPGWIQEAYEVDVDGDTALVESPESVLVPWPSSPLTSREQRRVRVRVRRHGRWSAWSDPLLVEAGLATSDWRARFVSPDIPPDATAVLRRTFEVPADVALARLYTSALGVFEVELNGNVVGDEVLAPGWTSYDHRLRYQTHDVTTLLRPGANVLDATLADGWFRGRLGWGGGRRAIYGDRLALLAQLEVVTETGERHCFATDGTWQWAPGPTTRASLYDGEDHDANLELGPWAPVEVLERDLRTLVAPIGPPVRRVEALEPKEIWSAPSGRTVVDFGQNLVGRLRLRLDGPPGTQVTLRHAEVLEDGELCLEPLRTAEVTDRYTLRGDGPEVWEPRFTFHGFRYADISGWPGALEPGDVTAVVLHSDLRRTGWFTSSDERLNRLHENVVWGMRGNFLDLPTDCPQRDERLGWTGDITVFSPTACFLHDVSGFLGSWLEDLAAEQDEHRGVPFVIPNVSGDEWIGTAVWGDAATEVPWTLFQRYGDTGVLEAQYESMRSWVDFVVRCAGPDRHWESPFQFGDWLDPAAPPDDPAAGRTDRHLVANAWFCRSLGIVAATAAQLGRHAEYETYHEVELEARAAFARSYVSDDGRLTSDSQTAYALAIRFGLVEGAVREAAGRRLAELVEQGGHRIGTGFAGTPIVTDALCDTGHVDTAYELLLQTEPPSWLYSVLQGATTIWERWDGIRPDGTRNPGEMNSFNHYALGAVADWLHRRVAGLAPAAPGYRRLRVAPLPTTRLDHAWARHETPYGTAEAGWRRAGTLIVVEALVPPNTSAEVVLPGGSAPFEVQAGRHTWEVAG